MAMQQQPPSPPSSRTLPLSGKPEEEHSLQQPNTAAVVMSNCRGSNVTHDRSSVVSREAKKVHSGSESSSHRTSNAVSNV